MNKTEQLIESILTAQRDHDRSLNSLSNKMITDVLTQGVAIDVLDPVADWYGVPQENMDPYYSEDYIPGTTPEEAYSRDWINNAFDLVVAGDITVHEFMESLQKEADVFCTLYRKIPESRQTEP